MIYEPTLWVTRWIDVYTEYTLDQFSYYMDSTTCPVCHMPMRWEVYCQWHQCPQCKTMCVRGELYASPESYRQRRNDGHR